MKPNLTWFVAALVLFFPISQSALAAPVTANNAAAAVQGWLRQDTRPLGGKLSSKIKKTESVKDAAGNVLYHVVHLNPAGYVIVAADDSLEPFVAFSATGRFDPSSRHGIAAWINRDLAGRMARAGADGERGRNARRKWQSALATSPNPPPDLQTNNLVVLTSQVWVAPFVQSLWSQDVDVSGSYACYNYYTPPYGAGNINNYPCGCVATAMAQVMYYFQYPTTGVGTGSFTIYNNGSPIGTNLMGGNGAGGPYLWSSMPLSPDNPTATQAAAIGALCFDAGITVNMNYSGGGSGASTGAAQTALTGTFKYSSADRGYAAGGLARSSLLSMINPSLDARLPVIIAIQTSDNDGHAPVCDGYGYSGSTLFHHLNMGWAGNDDVWYALPNIDTPDSMGDYTMVTDCVCDIYTNKSGPILSGRITDPTGAPVAGATVSATCSGSGPYGATTDTNGIYALPCLPANTLFSVTASNAGAALVVSNCTTGKTINGSATTGNLWGVNFTLSPALLAMPETGFAAIGPVGGPFNVTSQAFTLTNSTASAISWAASSLPSWLTITPASGVVAAGSASNFSISLAAAASSLGAGSNTATVWITNLTTSRAQAIAFSLAVKTADYPIAVSGYNDDVVVENTAVGGNTLLYADMFDNDGGAYYGPFCLYQHGLVAYNFYNNYLPSVEGLPQSGLFTSAYDGATLFQLGPYVGYNVLALSQGTTSGTLTLAAPLPYKSLSVLAATAEGSGTGTLVLHFADGASSSAISFKAANYWIATSPGSGAALTNFGVLATGAYNSFYVCEVSYYYPAFYQTTINLQSLGLHTKAINSITFTMPAGLGSSAVTGVFALSGTQSPFPTITSQPQSASIGMGGSASMSVGASGSAPMTNKWLLNGSVLAVGQGCQVGVTNACVTNAGNYQVIVTNAYGAVTSAVATLSISNQPVAFVTGAAASQYSGGFFQMQLTNLAGQGPVVVSASTNLTQWTPVFTNPSGFGTFNYTDSNAAAFPGRYYRAAAP